jgi:glycosyltransferase involved in cell wall biosynthesis
VIVPTRGRAGQLEQALAPLLAEPELYELLVVIDGDDPATAGLVRRLAAGDSRVRAVAVPPPGNGSDGGRQAGAEQARGEVLLFLDDDIVAEPGIVSGHAAWHGGPGRRVVLGYFPIRRRDSRRRGELASELYDEGYESTCDAYEADPARILVEFWAGNFSIRRDDALAVGLINPVFDSGVCHADRDFGLRLRRTGVEPVFDRTLRAAHHHRRSWSQFRYDCRRQGIGHVLMHRLHGDVLGPLAIGQPQPRWVARLTREARRPRLRPLVQGALGVGAAAGCAAGRRGDAMLAARISRQIGFEQGVVEAGRRWPHSLWSP